MLFVKLIYFSKVHKWIKWIGSISLPPLYWWYCTESIPSREIEQKSMTFDHDFGYSFHIEQKGMPFDHNFGYSFSLFSSLLKESVEEKENELEKNRDQKSCLSARSSREHVPSLISRSPTYAIQPSLFRSNEHIEGQERRVGG